MINTERILGGLLSAGLGSSRRRRRRRGSANLELAGSLGIGALGVAMAAFEHFRQKEPAPTVPTPAGGQSAPPPLPGAQPPPPPLASPTVEVPGDSEALLLVRAMVAAASADGIVDGEERKSIFARLHGAGLSDEEKTFVAGELSSPPRLEEIIAEVKTPELARRVYAVSLLAVTVDTDEERGYLAELRRRLDLDESEAKSLEDELGLDTDQ